MCLKPWGVAIRYLKTCRAGGRKPEGTYQMVMTKQYFKCSWWVSGTSEFKESNDVGDTVVNTLTSQWENPWFESGSHSVQSFYVFPVLVFWSYSDFLPQTYVFEVNWSLWIARGWMQLSVCAEWRMDNWMGRLARHEHEHNTAVCNKRA